MTKAFIGQVLLFGLLLRVPLFAESIDDEVRIPINDVGKIVVEGESLAEAWIGVDALTTCATVKSWEGEELAIIQEGNSSLGRISPLSVSHSRNGNETTLSLTRERSLGIGMRIGKIEITFLIPEAWEGELELRDFSVKTRVEGLRTRALTGNMKLANLTITNSDIGAVDLSMGADSDFEAENVRAGSWTLRGKLGKITARNITGPVDAETSDGAISLDFADFQGSSRLLSKLGRITVTVPEDSQLNLSLSSTLESVKTDLPVIGPVTVNDPHRLEGHVGASQNLLTAHSGDGRVRVLSR